MVFFFFSTLSLINGECCSLSNGIGFKYFEIQLAIELNGNEMNLMIDLCRILLLFIVCLTCNVRTAAVDKYSASERGISHSFAVIRP